MRPPRVQFFSLHFVRPCYTAPMPSDLVALIKAKREQIAKLQAELDEARAALAGDARPIHPAPASPSRKPLVKGRVAGRQAEGQTLTPDSAAYWAAEAIRAAGQPVHARDIIKAVERDGHKVKFVTLVGTLCRWHKKRRIFYRAGKNTFGLIEMRKA